MSNRIKRSALVVAASAVGVMAGGTAIAEAPPAGVQITPPIDGRTQGSIPPDDPRTVNVTGVAFTPEVKAGSKAAAARAADKRGMQRSASDCPSGWDCMWTGGYFTGPMGKLQGRNATWGNFPQSACSTSGTAGANWKDCASSVNARTSNGFDLARDINYGGGGLHVSSGNSVQDLDPWLMDNTTASNYY
jgi:hypothetical protein